MIYRLINVSSVAILAGVVLSGCATPVAPPTRDIFPKTEATYSPTLEQISTAEIGDSIISKEYVSRGRGISVTAAVAEDVNPPGTTSVLPGDFELIASRADGEYYQGRSTYSMLGTSVPLNDRAGVFIPADKKSPAVIYHYALAYRYGTRPVSYVTKDIVRFTSESFRRELVYSGVSQNTVTLVYREFKDNLARPAFTQELKYDLAQSHVVGYKGARFEIVSAGNTKITYKVLKQLD